MSNRLKMIPLSQLRPSKANIRKTNPLADIPAMANNIEEKDLLENLVVQAASQRNGHDKLFDVVAGSRRFAALKLLAKRRKIPRDHPIRCLVLDAAESAVEISLAENMLRMPIHPADQFEAFASKLSPLWRKKVSRPTKWPRASASRPCSSNSASNLLRSRRASSKNTALGQ